MIFLTFIGLLITTILSLALSKRVIGLYFTPVSAFPLSFLVAVVVYILSGEMFYPISALGSLGILVGVGCYMVGSLAMLIVVRKIRPWHQEVSGLLASPKALHRLIVLVFSPAFISTIIHVQCLIRATETIKLWDIYIEHFYLIDTAFLIPGWALLWDLHMLVVPLTAIYLTRFRQKRFRIWIIGFLSLASLALKGDLFYVTFPLLTSVSTVVALSNPRTELRKAGMGLLFAVVLATSFFIITYSFYFHDYTVGLTKMQVYASGSLVAFDQLLWDNWWEPSLGRLFFIQFLNAVFGIKPDSTTVYQVGARQTTNVVSFLGTLYLDFGWIGLLAGTTFFGSLGVLTVWWARRARNLISAVTLGTFTAAALLAFFGNFFGFFVEFFLLTTLYVIEVLYIITSRLFRQKSVI